MISIYENALHFPNHKEFEEECEYYLFNGLLNHKEAAISP